jgi:signal transduction histidine kinase
MELRRQPTDLVMLVRQVGEQMRAAAEHHAFQFEPSVDSLVGDWDGLRLEQVVFNLLENAQKYSPRGGTITVRVGKEKISSVIRRSVGSQGDLPAVASHATEGAEWAVVAISDEGIGIPKESEKHLFDRFYRAANAKGRAETGLGLGLYICHEVVVQHGGTIWVESTEGKGSTFYFALPL